jgi:hypothetical protein
MATSLNPLLLPTAQQEKLHHLTSLLHLFHHRNHNQHHHSIWYRPFSLFRRELARLTADITLYTTPATTHLARTRKKTLDATLLARTEKRMIFWRDVMVPKWYHAFGQLVADGRFAVLGLVLMAVLGEVCGVVGITSELEEMGQREVERVLEEFGKEEWGIARSGLAGQEIEVEDRGEVIVREEAEEEEALSMKTQTSKPKADGGSARAVSSVIEEPESKQLRESSPTLPRARMSDLKRPRESTEKLSDPLSKPSKKKKKRKKGDAIDDLFDF